MMDLIIGGDTDSIVYTIHAPDIIQMLFQHAGINLVQIHCDEKENILDGISHGDGNFLLVLPSVLRKK